MGLMNLLKANWTGKVGQTVGAKWKNKSTIRSFTKPAYTNTPRQEQVRDGFRKMSSYVALFADQIKSLSALNTKGMSVRNAIIKLNKQMVATDDFEEEYVSISRGGLPTVRGFTASAPAGLASVTCSWTAMSGATISSKARVVAVFVDQTQNFVAVGSALLGTLTLTIPTNVPSSAVIHVHYYLLDYRGSSKIASPSLHVLINAPVTK